MAFAKKPANAFVRKRLRMLVFDNIFARTEVLSSSTSLYTLEKWTLKPMSLLFVTIPTGFPVDLLGKLAEKIANSYHMISGHLVTSCKCKQVDKHPNYSHESGGRASATFHND